MLRSAIGLAHRRPAPSPRIPGSNGGPGCSHATRRMHNYGTTDDFKATMATLRNWPWTRTELLFGCITATLMATYKYNVRGKTILGYRPEEARKEREARKQREEMAKNNIDITFC